MKNYFLFLITTLFITVTGCSTGRSSVDVFGLVQRADKAYIQSRWFEASQLYHQVTEAVPDDAYAWFRLGNTYLRQGRIESAIHAYEQTIARDENHAKALYNLSLAYAFKALYAAEQADESLGQDDPASELVKNRIKRLQALVRQPAEQTESPASKLEMTQSSDISR